MGTRSNKLTAAQRSELEAASKQFFGEPLQEFWVAALESGSAEAGIAAAKRFVSERVRAQKGGVSGGKAHPSVGGNSRTRVACEDDSIHAARVVLQDDYDTPESVLIAREEQTESEPDSTAEWRTMDRLIGMLDASDQRLLRDHFAGVQQRDTASRLGVRQQTISARLKALMRELQIGVEVLEARPRPRDLYTIKDRVTPEQYLSVVDEYNGICRNHRALRRALAKLDPDTKLVKYLTLLGKSGYHMRWARRFAIVTRR